MLTDHLDVFATKRLPEFWRTVLQLGQVGLIIGMVDEGFLAFAVKSGADAVHAIEGRREVAGMTVGLLPLHAGRGGPAEGDLPAHGSQRQPTQAIEARGRAGGADDKGVTFEHAA